MSPRRRIRCRRGGDTCEALFDIPDQIVNRLDAHRESNRPWTDAGRAQLFLAQLPMRRARGMDDQALGIADIGQMRPQGDAAYEILAGGTTTATVEREHGASTIRQVLLDEWPIPARGQ